MDAFTESPRLVEEDKDRLMKMVLELHGRIDLDRDGRTRYCARVLSIFMDVLVEVCFVRNKQN